MTSRRRVLRTGRTAASRRSSRAVTLLRFTLDELAQTIVTLHACARRTGRCTAGARDTRRTLRLQAGQRRIRLRDIRSGSTPRAGRYLLRITAEDAAGNTSRTQEVVVRVRR